MDKNIFFPDSSVPIDKAIDRGSVMKRIRRKIDNAQNGRGGALEIFGISGIGKSSMMKYAINISRRKNTLGLEINCSESLSKEDIIRGIYDTIDDFTKVRADRFWGRDPKLIMAFIEEFKAEHLKFLSKSFRSENDMEHSTCCLLESILIKYGFFSAVHIYCDNFEKVSDDSGVSSFITYLFKHFEGTEAAKVPVFVILSGISIVPPIWLKNFRNIEEIQLRRIAREIIELEIQSKYFNPRSITCAPEAIRFLGLLSKGMPSFFQKLGHWAEELNPTNQWTLMSVFWGVFNPNLGDSAFIRTYKKTSTSPWETESDWSRELGNCIRSALGETYIHLEISDLEPNISVFWSSFQGDEQKVWHAFQYEILKHWKKYIESMGYQAETINKAQLDSALIGRWISDKRKYGKFVLDFLVNAIPENELGAYYMYYGRGEGLETIAETYFGLTFTKEESIPYIKELREIFNKTSEFLSPAVKLANGDIDINSMPFKDLNLHHEGEKNEIVLGLFASNALLPIEMIFNPM